MIFIGVFFQKLLHNSNFGTTFATQFTKVSAELLQ